MMVLGTKITDPALLVKGTPIVIEGRLPGYTITHRGRVSRVDGDRLFFVTTDEKECNFLLADTGIVRNAGGHFNPYYSTYLVPEEALTATQEAADRDAMTDDRPTFILKILGCY